jgi:TolB-like protein/Flp pilus assembly protein TadD/DNA-binding winged helix-turn-helix (wHTH) protein
MRVGFCEYQLDTETRTLQREGRRIPVQSKAFDLLAYLIERRERVVCSDELLDALWPGLHVTPAALSTAVQKARQAVGDDGEHQAVLHTEHGKGFRFVAEVTDLSTPETAQPIQDAVQPTPETDRPGSAGAAQIPLIAELKRRNVFRVAAAYGIVAWLLVEAASVVLPALHLPEWVLTLLVFLVVAGFPLALILAWAFELTPEGIERETAVDRAKSITRQTGHKLDFAIIGLLVVALIFVVVDHYVLEAEPERAEAPTEHAPAAKPVARGRSIAVLPFANMSQDVATEPFTNGIYDDILTHISKIRDLKVIARTTMERLDPNLGVQEIGTKLGVAAVLEGGVQRVGDRVRINVQLNDCETESHLWAETYDRELTAVNIFTIQSEIATAVADALQAELSPEERDGIATAPTESLPAYEAYLLGRQRMAKYTIASVLEAADYFNRATELDPSYAMAYVGLADSYSSLVHFGYLPLDHGLEKAQAATDKALELDDRLGEAYNSLAAIKEEWGDLEGAEVEYRHALELNPNYATAYHWYAAMLLNKLGRHEEALSLFLKAAELDPLSAAIVKGVGSALESLGQFDEALAWYERSLELDPTNDNGYWGMGFYHWSVTGKLDQAVAWYRRAISIEPDHWGYPTALGAIFLDLGDPDRAEYWFERSIKLGPGKPWVKVQVSFLNLYRGDEPAAVDLARNVLADSPHSWGPVVFLRKHELSSGRYVKARTLYEKTRPKLLNDDDPEIGRNNWGPAIDLALVLSKTGENERADLLLEKSLRHIQTKPRLGGNGHGLADVEIFALQGKKQKALSTLRRAIDEGWRRFWWWALEHEPNLASLRAESEFQAMVEEIRADMAAQLEHVREMERNGELEPIPQGEANLH